MDFARLKSDGSVATASSAAAADAEDRSAAGEELWWPPRELAGVTVTPDTALSFSGVYCAHNVLSTDTACLPLRVYRERPDGGQDLQTGHDVDDMLAVKPNEVTPAMRFRQALMGNVCGWGNGLAEIVRKGRGTPASLEIVDVATTRPVRSTNGSVYYDGTSLKRPIPLENMLHFAGFSLDGLWGLSPVKLHRQGIGLALAAQAFGATFFGNGSQASGYLKTSKTLKKEARENLRDSIGLRHQGPYNAHKIMLLEDGVEWAKNSIDPEDAQFLATRAFEILEIARMYRLPPHKLGDFSQSHLTNIEASNLDYLMTSLMPWLVMIEQECTRKLLTRAERKAGFFVCHDFSFILRGDMKATGDYLSRLFGLSVLTPNDVAKRLKINPIGPEGDRRYVSVNFQTVEAANAPKGPAAAPAKGQGKPADDGQGDDKGTDAGDGNGDVKEGSDDGNA